MQSLTSQHPNSQPIAPGYHQLLAPGLSVNTNPTQKTRLIGGASVHPPAPGLNASGVLLYQDLKSQLNNDSSDQAGFKTHQYSARHKKQALQISLCIEKMAALFGLQNLGFLTLTFRDNVTCPKEAQKRFNSLATNALKPRYGEYIAIRERQKRGAIHYHLLVPVFNDIRTGFDWSDLDTAKTLPRGKRYPSASPALRAEWRFWRQTAPNYNFGRTEILPIRSSREAISKYIGKYLGKDLQNSTADDKGARRISITSGVRAGTIHFQLLNSSTRQWRQNVAKFAELVGRAYHTDVRQFSDLTQKLGPRWAYLNATMINDLTDERMALYRNAPADRLRAWILADPVEKLTIQPEAEPMKTCNRCAQALPPEKFVLARMNRDGRSNRCKKCHSAATMHSLAKKRAKATAYPVATTDAQRSAPYNAAQGGILNKYWRLPDLSHLVEIPTWKL